MSILSSVATRVSTVAVPAPKLRASFVTAPRAANTDDAQGSDRRSVMIATSVLPTLLMAPKALALIPDEDDEELVERAKARRQERLKAERNTQRQFIQEEGLRNRSLDKDVLPVQRAVYKLAQTGSELESGDLPGAASILSDSWIREFQTAADNLSVSQSARSSETIVFDKLGALTSSAKGGNVTAAKGDYVAAVDAVVSWCNAAGIASSIKGL